MLNLGNLLKGIDNGLDNNFSLFQLKSIKEVTKKIAHGKKITKLKKKIRQIVLFSSKTAI